MLMGIPDVFTPDALRLLRQMGHGDELIIGDGNFSSTADATGRPVVWLAGYSTLEVAEAVLQVMPLDDVRFGPPTAYIVEGDEKHGEIRKVSDEFIGLVVSKQVESRTPDDVGEEQPWHEEVRRKSFHEQAKKAFAVFATNDRTHYACFRLRMGSLLEL
jgi:L-fucose mutarotase